MNEFLKNLRSNQNYNQKQEGKFKGQQRHDSRGKASQHHKKDIPEYLKALLDDLAPDLKKFLNHFADSQVRLAAAGERQAEALEKLAAGMPETVSQTLLSPRRTPRRRKIDEQKQEVLELINRLRDENMTYEEVAAYLEENRVPTFSGRGRWHAQTIHRLYMYYP